MWNEEKLKQQLGDSWYPILKNEFKMPYMKRLHEFLQQERAESKTVLPSEDNIFHWFLKCPFEKTMVVLLGIDPALHQSKDIIGTFRQELIDDIYDGIIPTDNLSLEQIAKQGVLILDTCLTYDLNSSFKHVGQGWEKFVEFAIQRLNNNKNRITFAIFGEYASASYNKFIDADYHKVIHIPHPRFQASFKGTKPFSKVNSFLKSMYNTEINF